MLPKQGQKAKRAIPTDALHAEDICDMTKHIELRRKVKSINRKTDFDSLIEGSMLNETEKRMMNMYYVENRTIDYIADILGYSPQGIIKMHKRILNRLESLL